MKPETWPVLFDPNVIRIFWWPALLVTIEMSVLAIALSFAFALAFALMRNARHPLLRWPATAWIEGVRSLPVLLLIIFVNFEGPHLLQPLLGEDFDIEPFWAGVIGLTIYTSAVLAEIIRAGIVSVAPGQGQAARALGLRYYQVMGYIVLPQALRRMVPAIVAQFTTLIKDSSLASVIAVPELLSRGKVFYAQYFNPVDTLLAVSMVYFVVNYALSLASRRLELGRLPRQARAIALRDQAA